MDGKPLRAIEPELIAGAARKFQEGEAVTGGAVAEGWALCERPGLPDGVAAAAQRIFECLVAGLEASEWKRRRRFEPFAAPRT